jgi:UDP:flavonoid glycosyltransferase YjiC (YdhE family)
MPRKRILFIAEAVTLAHVARPFLLAKSLNLTDYEVCFASHPRYKALLGEIPFAWNDIASIPSERFLTALAKGASLYDAETLRSYVREDIALIKQFNPDVVVGDFRLSLSISARICGKPYITITNAYWSPFGNHPFPVPELPLTRLLGAKLGQVLFDIARPLAFALHSLPLNSVRKEYGLPTLGNNLLKVYTDGDYTAYADIPEISPTFDLPANHSYLGPLVWSPSVAMPAWWENIAKDCPIIYVTLGSSGQSNQLGLVINALEGLPVTVIAATAGRTSIERASTNVYVTDHVPGETVCAAASLVICNGGSPTTYQALKEGKPVVGIASNLDQYLNMSMVQNTGAGKLLRAGKTTVSQIRAAVQHALSDADMTSNAQKLKNIISQYHPEERFEALLRFASGSHQTT